MGFFGALSKMAQGKPVFDDPEHQPEVTNNTPTPAQPSTHTPLDAHGYKIIPVVTLTHCRSRQSGQSMHVTVQATNTSDLEVELDKIIVDGTRREIDRRLSPQASREIVVYDGPLGSSEYKKAELIYKLISSGDYFRANFMVEYNREGDGSYTIEEFHPEYPIHDV